MQKGMRPQGARYWKLHGAGNDLLVVHSKDLPGKNKAQFVRRMAHRQLGIGCDQLAEVLSLKPLSIQIWNQDGTKAEMCANGSRTFLYLAAREGWLDRKAKRVPLQVSGGQYEGVRATPGNYELSLGAPEIGIPSSILLGREKIPYVPVRTGNPHAVIWMAGRGSWKAPKAFDFKTYGPRVETHRAFPKKTNVEFIRSLKVSDGSAEVLVEAWERGAGATLSCGSGAVAVAALVRRRTGVARVRVRMTDFVLKIRFEGEAAFLSGPCALVSSGSYFGIQP
jgi:diaminopimelate epimerase